MNRTIAIACTIAIAGLTAACTQKDAGSTSATTAKSANVAVVDGRSISRNTFDEYVKSVSSTPAGDLTENQRNGLLENLVRAQVLSAAAEANGVAKKSETLATLELHRLNVLSEAASKQYLEDHKVTDAELHAEYDTQVAGMDKVQLRASHILVKTQEEAQKIIAQLKAGANFADIARKVSLDTVSREKGGDLEWFSPSTMVPAFAQAITSLKKGETSAAPVQTEYGWHVLRVTDTREATPPTFEQAKARLEELVRGKKMKAYVEELMAKAKITKSL